MRSVLVVDTGVRFSHGLAAARSAKQDSTRNAILCKRPSGRASATDLSLTNKVCPFNSLYSELRVYALILEAARFGRHLFPYSQLLAHVHAVFLYFRRCYFNRIRKEYKIELAQITDPEELSRILRKWVDEDYSPTARRLVCTRLSELGVSSYFTLLESAPAPPVLDH